VSAADVRALVDRVIGDGVAIRRVARGSSTQVFRLERDAEVMYLRVAEEAGGSIAVEAAVHDHLRAAGLRLPEVVALDDGHEVGRSVMIVREVPGTAILSPSVADVEPVLRAAGRDLARLNEVSVEGYGWIRRDTDAWPLRGEDATYRAFVEHVPSIRRIEPLLRSAERAAFEELLDEARVDDPHPRLVHGDFDRTHIYQRDGVYSGMIDLGEIRGAEWWYDLAYFHLQDAAPPLLPPLVAGYAEITPLPSDLPFRLRRSAVMIAGTQLARWLDRDGSAALDGREGRRWVVRLRELLAARPG
jgi:Ser/Thr protein kinase RdoA (MazF antagonist)